jgi:hypothetical protein
MSANLGIEFHVKHKPKLGSGLVPIFFELMVDKAVKPKSSHASFMVTS